MSSNGSGDQPRQTPFPPHPLVAGFGVSDSAINVFEVLNTSPTVKGGICAGQIEPAWSRDLLIGPARIESLSLEPALHAPALGDKSRRSGLPLGRFE